MTDPAAVAHFSRAMDLEALFDRESVNAFVEKLPCSRATFYRMRNGRTLGDLDTWLAIIRETGGRVTPNDHPLIAAAIKEHR